MRFSEQKMIVFLNLMFFVLIFCYKLREEFMNSDCTNRLEDLGVFLDVGAVQAKSISLEVNKF